VNLENIEVFTRERGLSAQFIHIAEAKEYRQTLAILGEAQKQQLVPAPTFPLDLFQKAAGA
jgi:hypothetical protein